MVEKKKLASASKPAKKRKVVSVARKAKKLGNKEKVVKFGVAKKSIVAPRLSSSSSTNPIKAFLTKSKIKFEILKHSPAFTAQQIAANAHISGKNLAKTVIVNIDGKLAMVVEPAHIKADLGALQRQLHARSVTLAGEKEFRNHFPQCELGAMPPLGNLYKMPVYVSDNLSRDTFITFNAGTHAELVKMSYKDFYNLVKPKVVYA